MADRFGGEVRPGERRVLRDRRGRDDVAQEAAEADRTAAEDRREKSEARREDAEWGRRATERERRGEARAEAKETQRRLDEQFQVVREMQATLSRIRGKRG